MPARRRSRVTVRLAANFERNLADIDSFLIEAEAPSAYDALMGELLETVIPNLERFPEMGRRFLDRPGGSVESVRGLEKLRVRMGEGEPLRLQELDGVCINFVPGKPMTMKGCSSPASVQ